MVHVTVLHRNLEIKHQSILGGGGRNLELKHYSICGCWICLKHSAIELLSRLGGGS